MTNSSVGHLHLLARSGATLHGNALHLTRTEIEGYLNGTPYRDELTLWDVVTGDSPRGYVIVPDGWVAIVRCTAATQEACADVLFRVTVAGDVSHADTHPDHAIAGIRRLADNKEN